MARPASAQPTELELLILKILWEEAPRQVSEIRQQLAIRGRDNAHTSVITVLNIMVEKGYLYKEKEGRSYWYRSRIKEEDVSNKMTGRLIDSLFGGSASKMMLNLIDQQPMDSDELNELKKLINQKLKGRNE